MKLFGYYRSSATYRVRIALHLKGLQYESQAIDLTARENLDPEYRKINPLGLVPCLQLDDGRVISQSGAIIEWLESRYPGPPLLPGDLLAQAEVRAWINTIACDVHPLNNLSVLSYLRDKLQVDERGVRNWYHHWLIRGFNFLEQAIVAAPYCAGDQVGMADVYLVPQLYNARRFKLALDPYPRLRAVDAACLQLPAFARCTPEATLAGEQ